MDHQKKPPSCIFGCGNMRHWSLIVPIINIIFWTVLTLFMVAICFNFILTVSFEIQLKDIFLPFVIMFKIVILSVGMIAVNIKLGFSVLKRERDPIRIWLLVQSTVVVLSTMLIATGVYCTVESGYGKTVRNYVTAEVLAGILIEGLLALSGIPVYAYYSFLQTCHRNNLTAGPVFSMSA